MIFQLRSAQQWSVQKVDFSHQSANFSGLGFRIMWMMWMSNWSLIFRTIPDHSGSNQHEPIWTNMNQHEPIIYRIYDHLGIGHASGRITPRPWVALGSLSHSSWQTKRLSSQRCVVRPGPTGIHQDPPGSTGIHRHPLGHRSLDCAKTMTTWYKLYISFCTTGPLSQVMSSHLCIPSQ